MSQASIGRNSRQSSAGKPPAALPWRQPAPPKAFTDGSYAFSQLLQILNARREIVLICMLVSFVCAGAFLVLAPSRYLASSTVLVDTPKMKLLRQDTVLAEQPTDEYLVESQIQVLRSDDVARRVVQRLDLLNSRLADDDMAFPFGKIRAMLGSQTLPGKADAAAATEKAVETLKNNIRVRRVGLSRILEVTYNSTNPQRAADVANAFIDSYIQDKRDLQEDATRRSIEWMTGQIEITKKQLSTAERAIETYKSSANPASASEYRNRLKELESYAQSYRSVLESLLPRYAEIVQQQGLPTNEARPVERAQVPKGKSQPRTALVAAFAGLFGLTLGIGLALLRDFMAGIRSARDIEAMLGIRAWGALPVSTSNERLASANAGKRSIARFAGASSLVLDAPTSSHAAALRSIISAVSGRAGGERGHIIGITSTLAGEGRSTVCLNLGQAMAASGLSVLLIDADRQNRKLSGSLATGATAGLLEVLSGTTDLSAAVWTDTVTGLNVLPIVEEWVDNTDPRHALAAGALLTSTAAAGLVAEIAGHYDHVIVCLPPLESSVDACFLSGWVDDMMLVIEWQKTPPNLILESLARVEAIEDKLIGAILNKVDPRYLARTRSLTTAGGIARDIHHTLVTKPITGAAPMARHLRAALPDAASGLKATASAAKKATEKGSMRLIKANESGTMPGTGETSEGAIEPRRFASSVVGGLLKNTGVLSFNISRIQSDRLLTNIYFHQPTADKFEKTIRWLREKGYTPVSTKQIEAAILGEGELPPLPLHISLDDAWRSNLTEVVPVASALDVPITIFVPTEPIQTGHYWWTIAERAAQDNGRTVNKLKLLPDAERRAHLARIAESAKGPRDAMTLDELKAIAKFSNVTIGSHTVTHPILTRCTDEDVVREATESKATLEAWLGREITAFAYPNGSFGRREVEAVRKAGYKLAFTVHQRHAHTVGENPLTLPRFALTNDGPQDADICRAVGVWPASPFA